jgi:hypothetical protein
MTYYAISGLCDLDQVILSEAQVERVEEFLAPWDEVLNWNTEEYPTHEDGIRPKLTDEELGIELGQFTAELSEQPLDDID